MFDSFVPLVLAAGAAGTIAVRRPRRAWLGLGPSPLPCWPWSLSAAHEGIAKLLLPYLVVPATGATDTLALRLQAAVES